MEYDGFISAIRLGDRLYKIRAEVVEVYPIVCPKCGASFELKYGRGKCPYCDTYYTTEFKLVEQKEY